MCACSRRCAPAPVRSAPFAPGRRRRRWTRSSTSVSSISGSGPISSAGRGSALVTSPSSCRPTAARPVASSVRRCCSAPSSTGASTSCAGAVVPGRRRVRGRATPARPRPPCIACTQGATAVETALHEVRGPDRRPGLGRRPRRGAVLPRRPHLVLGEGRFKAGRRRDRTTPAGAVRGPAPAARWLRPSLEPRPPPAHDRRRADGGRRRHSGPRRRPPLTAGGKRTPPGRLATARGPRDRSGAGGADVIGVTNRLVRLSSGARCRPGPVPVATGCRASGGGTDRRRSSPRPSNRASARWPG